MLARRFKPLANRFLRFERRNLPEEIEAKSAVAFQIVKEVKRMPIVLNGFLWTADDSNWPKRTKVQVMT